MKKTIICLLLFVVGLCGLASGAAPRDVLVHASNDWIWFARISRTEEESTSASMPPTDKTEAFARHNGPGQSWQEMPSVIGRASAMACRSSQLVLLMNDGQWMTVWSDGSATGQALPAEGRMLTIADDGENLWAIGSVPGGRAAADAALLRDANSTQPTTAPVTLAVSGDLPTTLPAIVSRLVVFKQSGGQWITVAELPQESSMLSQDGVSMTVIDGVPIVSFMAGKVVTLRLSAQQHWEDVASLEPINIELADNIKLFNDGRQPLLWLTHGNSPGELFFTNAGAGDSAKLAWNGSAALDGPPAIAYGGGFVRVLGTHAKKVFEQRYQTNGQPVGTPAEVTTMAEPDETRLPYGIDAVFLLAMAFSVGASIYRQWAMGDDPIQPPAPAPLMPRFFAGLIDLLPVLAATGLIVVGSDNFHDALFTPSIMAMEVLLGGIAVYVIHTTAIELLTGRTLGKWLTGLKVVSLDGTPASPGQILTRNVLRLVDPLVMIVLSPLRQRSADLVAGTIVVRATVELPAELDSKADPAEKK